MSGTEWWWLSLAIAALVVVVVAVLLGLIVAAARNIDRNAYQIWIEGKKIAGNTVSIWLLEKNDRRLRDLRGSLERLEKSAAGIEQGLRRTPRPGPSNPAGGAA